jgi:tRNA 2-thiouridine synthesizing protein E
MIMTPEQTPTDTQFDEEGYILDPKTWSRDLAIRVAAREGIPRLDENHWLVIEYLRSHYHETGSVPVMRHICRDAGLEEHCVSDLLGDPKRAWRIAGLPNPGEEANAYIESSDIPDGA